MHLNKQAIDEREWDEGRNGGWGKDRRWRAASIGLLGSFILAQLVKKKKNEAKRPTISDKSKIKTSQVIIYCTRTRCLCERQYEKDLSFSTELNHNTDSCCERMGEGEEGMRVMQRKIKEAAVTLQVSLEPCQQEWCGGMSGIGQTTKEKSEPRRNKDLRQSSLQYTACMRLLLCHTQNTPPA